MYRQNLPSFQENLNIELNNITLPGEKELATKLGQLHQRYTERAEAFEGTTDLNTRRDMYFREMLPIFTEIKDTENTILHINQEAMIKADRDARRISAASTRYMIIALGSGLLLRSFLPGACKNRSFARSVR